MKRILCLSSALALAASAWAASTLHNIDQKDKMFSQPELTVRVGDQLEVHNLDTVTHSLFAKTAEYNIRETQAPGAQSTFTFDKPGSLDLRCAIHPQMILKITVQP
jgi:plastocyanin